MYHVTIADAAVGGEILPGRYSSTTRCFLPGAPPPSAEAVTILLWELAFESVRVAVAKEKPSRLQCVYLWETLEAARLFRSKFRPQGQIVKVEYDARSRIHRGDFDIYSNKRFSEPYVDFMPSAALQYWLNEPEGTVEILVDSPAKIIEVLAANFS